MIVQNCTFKRTENGPVEQGISCDEGTLIIDMDCEIVGPLLWTYNLRTEFVITIPDTRKQ